VCSEIIMDIEVIGESKDEEDEEESSSEGEDDLTQISNLYKVLNTRKAKKKLRVTKNTPVEIEIKNFFHMEVNWYQNLVKQGCKDPKMELLGAQTSLTYVQHWEFIAENFDVMKWWEEFGKFEYPHIYIIACLILPLPDSNASQERTFSSATWMDGKLNKRQSDATFQMKIVLQQNSDFLDQTRIHVEEDYKKKMAEDIQKLVEEAMDNRSREYDIYEASLQQKILEERQRVEGNLNNENVEEENNLEDNDNDDSNIVSGKFRESDMNDEVDYDEEALEEFFEFESQKLD